QGFSSKKCSIANWHNKCFYLRFMYTKYPAKLMFTLFAVSREGLLAHSIRCEAFVLSVHQFISHIANQGFSTISTTNIKNFSSKYFLCEPKHTASTPANC